jgi:hypothetical protein
MVAELAVGVPLRREEDSGLRACLVSDRVVIPREANVLTLLGRQAAYGPFYEVASSGFERETAQMGLPYTWEHAQSAMAKLVAAAAGREPVR